jgi:hypothetical protein
MKYQLWDKPGMIHPNRYPKQVHPKSWLNAGVVIILRPSKAKRSCWTSTYAYGVNGGC